MFIHFSIILKIFKKKGKKFDQNSYDALFHNIENNLRELLMESEKLVFKHTLKAEQISSNEYLNHQKKVFGYH